jgi:murein DD-endopeptidase MepM/ murein hydrolase activator NlpD
MSIRDRYPHAKLPRSHYFLTVSRGDKVRAFAVRPAVAMAALAAAPLFALWAFGATAFIACHDEVVTTLLSREAQLQSDYEAKLSDARAELDRASSRQLLDQSAFEGKMRDLVSRQAKLESRGAALAALAAEAGANATALADARPRGAAKPSSSALTALQAIGGPPADGDLGGAGAPGAASAYAPAPATKITPLQPAQPVKPRPLDGESASRAAIPADRLAGELAAAASDASLDRDARVGLVGYSLDRVERAQLAALDGVAHKAHAAAAKFETIVQRTGLSLAALKEPQGGVGGPFIPVSPDDPAFGRAVAGAAREIEAARKLRKLMPHLPVRYPLVGDATLSSPFGYRSDPFLGRPALHPGVDMVQPYGSEIKATAIGRVTHAGPMGGYGNCVEIDHGNGIATRYGHMSEVLVEEGQTVEIGETLGRIGSTGRSTGAHLHYEVRVDGEAVDPERFLNAARD